MNSGNCLCVQVLLSNEFTIDILKLTINGGMGKYDDACRTIINKHGRNWKLVKQHAATFAQLWYHNEQNQVIKGWLQAAIEKYTDI